MVSNTDLVPIFTGELNAQPVQLVNARDLHQFLESNRQFADWIKERIEEYEFVENKDFILISQKREIKKRGGDRRSKDYQITLDMAKQLAMVERTEKGKQARRYFIDCEYKAQEQAAQPQALPAPVDELPEEVRAAIARKAHALAMEGFEQIRARLEQRAREQLVYRRPKEFLLWLKEIGGPDAELIVLSAHELWDITSMVAIAHRGTENALAAIHDLEAKTGRWWHGRPDAD